MNKKNKTTILALNDFNNLYNFFKFFFKKHFFSKNKLYFKWQYQSNQKKLNIVALKISGKIRGFQFFIPINFFDKKLSGKEIFLTNFYCDAKIIGGGQVLFKYLISILKPHFIGTIGFREIMISYHKKLGFKVGTLDHYYLKKNMIKSKKFNNNFFNILNKKDIFSVNKKIFSFQTPTKSKRFILNRYINHPIYNYIIYADNKKNSIIIFREIKFQNKKILKIIDFFGKSSSFVNYKSLFYFLILEKGYYSIDIYCHGIKKNILQKSGLKKTHKKEIVPEFYEPFVKKNIKINFGYLAKKNVKNVRLFKGDGDRDRPAL
jgi:hypothetical protein